MTRGDFFQQKKLKTVEAGSCMVVEERLWQLEEGCPFEARLETGSGGIFFPEEKQRVGVFWREERALWVAESFGKEVVPGATEVVFLERLLVTEGGACWFHRFLRVKLGKGEKQSRL